MIGPTPNPKAAIEFLQMWSPAGPWVLTAIVPDGKTDTATFAADMWRVAGDWIESRQHRQNIYFHVNPVRKALTCKASKEDVARMAWLHVDLDPRAGEDFTEERARALGLLRAFSPKPTIIVDSGGGYQGFWRLHPSKQLEVGGVIPKAQELECYNIQLEKQLGADNCHNLDRIMRLPGTINWPNAKKLAKGRHPALAELVDHNPEAIYRIEQFAPAVRVQVSYGQQELSGGRPRVQIATGNVADIGTDELRRWAKENGKVISDHCLALIATGQDPIDPTRYPSRSEVLFRVCCDLVRATLPDEMIFAVITGANEVAVSVREKPNWEAYALRQIERAHEEAVDPWLRRLNEKHAAIEDIGGKCRIISEVMDPMLKRPRISKQSFDDFRNRYRNALVQVGTDKAGEPIMKQAGGWWIDHPQRRQYSTIVFAPGREVADAYNLWGGFACNALPGELHQKFLMHIRNNICSGNPEYYAYLIGWMAALVQHPDGPGEVAVVLRGKRGTGKSFFAKELGKLFGRHFLQVSDSKHLVGSFNAHLRDTVLLFGDEAFFAGDRKHESVLKTLVTEERLVIEGKGLDAESAPNFVHLILASNEDWVVPAGLDERRFFVLEMGDGVKQDHNYFKAIRDDLDAGGTEHLLHFLMTYDLSSYAVRSVPQTRALMEQKLLSLTPEMQWLYNRLWEGRMLRTQEYYNATCLKSEVYDDYIQETREQGRNYRMSPIIFGKFLVRCMPPGFPTVRQRMVAVTSPNEYGVETPSSKRAYVYGFPSLEQIREYWDRTFGGPFDWPPVEEQDELPRLDEASAF